MMINSRFSLIIAAWLLFSMPTQAAQLDKQSATNLIEQMGGAISTKYEKTIANFFKFYSTTDAVFVTTTIAVDPENSKLAKERTFSRNREEYIKHVVEMTSNFQAYSYIPTIQNFIYNKEKNTAIVKISVEEEGITSPPIEVANRVVIKTKVATNCNITMVMASGSPLINGMSCIEKILVQ